MDTAQILTRHPNEKIACHACAANAANGQTTVSCRHVSAMIEMIE